MTDLLGGTKKKTSKWPWHKAFWDFPGTVTVTAFGIAVVLLCVIWCSCLNLDDATKLTLTVGISGGLLLVLNFASNYRRTVAFEEQLEQQRLSINQQHEGDKRRDQQQLYATNVQHLGHSDSESVRLGGIYGLARLAKVSPDWVTEIADILFAHIRTTTVRSGYGDDNEEKPATEIAVILKVLTQGENNPFSLVRPDLRRANLKNISLIEADLGKANLRGIGLIGANLSEVSLVEANLRKAKLRGANLSGTNLREADLRKSDLMSANLKGANLFKTKLDEVDLSKAKLNGVRRLSDDESRRANFRGCTFDSTDLKGIYWGVITERIQREIDDGTSWGRDREIPYLEENSVRRELTPKEKEYLVGKENVEKCIWGDVWVLEEKGTQGNSNVK